MKTVFCLRLPPCPKFAGLALPFILLPMLLFPLAATCQPPRGYMPGDSLPASTMAGIKALAGRSAELYVLNFINPGCKSSMQELPGIVTTQQAFKSRMAVLHVTRRSSEEVRKLASQYPELAGLRIVAADTALVALFPHRYTPHLVWIDRGGIIKAVTTAEYLDVANVQAVLANQPAGMPVKEDREYDFTRPLYDNSNESRYYGMMTGNKPDMAPDLLTITDSNRQSRRFTMINYPLLRMYQWAFGHFVYYPAAMIAWKVRDTSKFLHRSGYLAEWERQHTWCYEQVMPARATTAECRQKMVQDLDAFSGSRVRMIDTLVDCLVLTASAEAMNKLQSKGGRSLNKLEPKHYPKQMRQLKLLHLVWRLNDTRFNPPVVDETGITQPVDMDLPFQSYSDIPLINRCLSPYGLRLQPARRVLQMMVFENNN